MQYCSIRAVRLAPFDDHVHLCCSPLYHQRWKQTVLTTFSVHVHPAQLGKIADLIR